ncbi:MAG: hypothetical protein HY596_02040 [Candidatus Omnitrophica bacterium]|nr:hypothetical protein [Candidatus Omnitrophota bacterium]
MTKLTQKQQTVLAYLQRYIGEHRRSPFLREIQDACRIASYKSVIDRLNALERKGFIKRTPNKHRAIHIHWKASAMLQPGGAASGPSPEPSHTSEPVPSTVAQAVPGPAGEAGTRVGG